MRVIDKIKKIFVKKQDEDKKVDTNITLFDVNDINLPSFNQLSDDDKKKVLKYKQQIDINNLDQIIKYNQDITIEGENITNLFIKYLYELNEITNKYGKTIDELNEDSVNLAIKNVKLIVLKEKLEDLRHDSYLKTIAIDSVNNEYKNRKHEFVELFSHATRIKRKNQLKSLEELETRSKITIKTLEQQLMAMSNAIINNNTMINQIDICNELSNKIKNSVRKEICQKKLDFYKKVNHYLFDYKLETDLLDIKMGTYVIKETQILKLIASIELEIDKYVLKNKDKINDMFFWKLKEIESAIQMETIIQRKQTLIEKINYLSVLAQIFNDYIDKNYINSLYEYKFNILTIDINSSKVNIIPETKEEFEVYKDILSEKISRIQKGDVIELFILKGKNRLQSFLKIFNKYFNKNGFNYEDILKDNFLLALLLAFDKKMGLKKFFNEKKILHDYFTLLCSFHEDIFKWKESLPLKIVCEIVNEEKKSRILLFPFIDKDFELAFELYNYCSGNIDIDFYVDDIHDQYLYKYTLPEGISEIKYDNSSVITDSLLYKIRQNSIGKKIVFPSSLKSLSGCIFGYISIRSIELNQGIISIGPVVFVNQILKEITFPSSLESIEGNSFDYKKIENITFLDFKNSKLLYNLLFSEEEKYKQALFNLFTCSYISTRGILITPRIHNLILNDNDSNVNIYRHQIEFKDTTGKREISLSINDIPYIREHLIKVIKEKTGFNFKEYHEEKILKK